jgi:hypothetical protein
VERRIREWLSNESNVMTLTLFAVLAFALLFFL